MADFDIFNPKISRVAKGIEGKLVLVHSDERKLGKTLQATRMPKPFYLRFEQGINAISNVPYAELNNWSDFKKVNKQLTNPKTIEQARETYSTIILDTCDVAIKWCEKYVCATQGVTRLNDGNSGYGLWKEMENEWFEEITKLSNAGYCVYFISHSTPVKRIDPNTNEEYEQMSPKGDKRTIDLIVDLVDIIGYVKSNGIDENGDIIPSSIYFANTKEFQAGSRFTFMPRVLKEFTAENFQEAIKKAIEMEEKESGLKGLTFDEKLKQETFKVWTHEEILEEIKKYFVAMSKEYKDEVSDCIYKYINEDLKLSETTKKQLPQLEMVLYDLQDLAKDKGIEV